MSPFEVFFGRKTNREINMLEVGEHKDPEEIGVEMESIEDTDLIEVC